MEPGKTPMVALLTWRTVRLVRRVAARARQSEGEAEERRREIKGERRSSTMRPTLASSSRERWRRRERVRWRRSAVEMCWRQVRRVGTRAPT